MSDDKGKRTRKRLYDALDTWKVWHANLHSQPKVLRDLNLGTTNDSFVVGCGGVRTAGLETNGDKRYCLRLNAENSSILGINREHEIAILNAIKGQSIGPDLVFYNKPLNFCIFEYIEGRCWTKSDYTRLTQRQKLWALIDIIQTVRVDIPRFDYFQHLKNYYAHVRVMAPSVAASVEPGITPFFKELEGFMRAGWKPVLCHHDLIPENIVEADNGLMLLDWEYAGLGHPDFDRRYAQHCLDNRFEQNTDALLSGDTLDRLIYWLAILWIKLNEETSK